MEHKKLAVRADVLQAKPVSLSLEEAVGTGIQQASKHFDLVLGVDFHWTMIPFVPVPLPLPHPFVGIIFDPIDYLHFDIPIPSFFQSEGGPTSIPMGGTVYVNEEHKATTTTSVMGIAVFGRHLTDLPGYKIVNMPGSPHDGEVYFGSQTVFAQEAELSGDQAQHVLTCWCPPMGLTALPNAPMKLSKNPLRYFAFYNHRLSAYIQIPGGDPVLVGGTFIPHQYSASELLMRFAAMGLIKGAGGLLKTFNKRVLRKLLGSRNPLSRALCFLGFDPINLVTGGLLFDWDDFEIGGNIPISWSNTYYSNYQLPMGSFGSKVFNCWDLMILPDLEQDAAAWINPQERITMSIPWVDVGAEETYYRPYKIRYYRPDENTWVLRQNQHTYYYQKMTHPT
ncbi:DUF6531 domain-containing protein, partial [Myroides sp. C6-3]|uniref:DUF6531 domain-containing protein n=1 Tax=Myroides sp. C6-3 TaxID=3400535 RepID=UPI003D2F5A86